MKRLPVLAAAAATAVAGVAVLTGTTTADAAVPAPTVHALDASTQSTQWYTASDLGTTDETQDPPTGSWFVDTSAGYTTPTFGPSGLTFPGHGALLHSTTGDATTALTDIASSTDTALGTADVVASGDADFTLLVDLNDDGSIVDGNYARLIAVAHGEDGIDGEYTSVTTVGTIIAGTPATLEQFQAQFAANDPTATIVDYGVSDAVGPVTVTGIAYDGANSYFTPKPTAGTITPDSVTASDLGTTGVQVSQPNGFLPGEKVDAVLISDDGTATDTGVTFIAGADGSVSGTVIAPGVAAGSYLVTLVGEDSGIVVGLPLDVVADPTAPVTTPTTPVAPVATPVTTTATFTG